VSWRIDIRYNRSACQCWRWLTYGSGLWFLTQKGCPAGSSTLDSRPRLRDLFVDAGFGPPTRTEIGLAASCDVLTAHRLAGASITRTLGLLGARLTLRHEGSELGFIEVCDQAADMARSSVATAGLVSAI